MENVILGWPDAIVLGFFAAMISTCLVLAVLVAFRKRVPDAADDDPDWYSFTGQSAGLETGTNIVAIGYKAGLHLTTGTNNRFYGVTTDRAVKAIESFARAALR